MKVAFPALEKTASVYAVGETHKGASVHLRISRNGEIAVISGKSEPLYEKDEKGKVRLSIDKNPVAVLSSKGLPCYTVVGYAAKTYCITLERLAAHDGAAAAFSPLGWVGMKVGFNADTITFPETAKEDFAAFERRFKMQHEGAAAFRATLSADSSERKDAIRTRQSGLRVEASAIGLQETEAQKLAAKTAKIAELSAKYESVAELKKAA